MDSVPSPLLGARSHADGQAMALAQKDGTVHFGEAQLSSSKEEHVWWEG